MGRRPGGGRGGGYGDMRNYRNWQVARTVVFFMEGRVAEK